MKLQLNFFDLKFLQGVFESSMIKIWEKLSQSHSNVVFLSRPNKFLHGVPYQKEKPLDSRVKLWLTTRMWFKFPKVHGNNLPDFKSNSNNKILYLWYWLGLNCRSWFWICHWNILTFAVSRLKFWLFFSIFSLPSILLVEDQSNFVTELKENCSIEIWR